MAPRDITVKTLLNADEFLDFDEELEAADEKASPTIRKLVKGWTAEQKHKRQQRNAEWPAQGQNMAMFLPTRVARPRMHMRL